MKSKIKKYTRKNIPKLSGKQLGVMKTSFIKLGEGMLKLTRKLKSMMKAISGWMVIMIMEIDISILPTLQTFHIMLNIFLGPSIPRK